MNLPILKKSENKTNKSVVQKKVGKCYTTYTEMISLLVILMFLELGQLCDYHLTSMQKIKPTVFTRHAATATPIAGISLALVTVRPLRTTPKT